MGRLSRALLVVLVGSVLTALPAGAGERINKDEDNVAIQGYDPVAYFTEGRPVQGKPAFEHEWQGARWWFANAEHRDLFKDEPARYAPRYGGFCSGGMTLAELVPADPENWVIIEGRLYLASVKRARDRFAADAEASIAKADANWEKLGQH